MAWTEHAQTILKESWAKGYDTGTILKILNAEGFAFTRNALIGRINRTGLNRQSPDVQSRERPRDGRFQRKLPRKDTSGTPAAEETASLKRRECRWIEDGHYCRERTVSIRSSWCYDHRKRATTVAIEETDAP